MQHVLAYFSLVHLIIACTVFQKLLPCQKNAEYLPTDQMLMITTKAKTETIKYTWYEVSFPCFLVFYSLLVREGLTCSITLKSLKHLHIYHLLEEILYGPVHQNVIHLII